MEIKVNTKVGEVGYQFNINEKDLKESLHYAAVLGNMPSYCHECKNQEKFKLDSNKDKEGNIYINVVCKACGAKAKLGNYRTGGIFWHSFEKYVKGEDQTKKVAWED
jgi:hypothetical protein